MTQTAGITHEALAQFYGTSQWYQGPFNRFTMTDGTFYLSQNGAGWLIDAIASYQGAKLDKQTGGFQLWTLKVNTEKRTAVLTCQADSDRPNLVCQKIGYTDFPLDEIKLYVEGEGGDRVCLLTGEH